MATMQERVAERYPSLLPLLKNPEVGKLLTQAVQNNWSPGVFQSKFMATNWFRSQSESQRRWWVTSATDPGEAKKQRNLMQQQIAAKARQLGISPTLAELSNIRETALRMGIGADDFWVTNALVGLTRKAGRTDVGAWSTTADQLRQISLNDYFKPLPDHVNKKWTTWIITGQKTLEDFQQASMREAIKRYPHLAEEIKQGMSPGDVVAPLRAIIADELELGDPSRVAMTDPKWRNLLGVRDPKTNKMRMMTESEVMKMARQDDRWGATAKGRQTQYSMVRSLMEMMGNRRF